MLLIGSIRDLVSKNHSELLVVYCTERHPFASHTPAKLRQQQMQPSENKIDVKRKAWYNK